jgi:FMN phosphatase YigB (HAD superfamily)
MAGEIKGILFDLGDTLLDFGKVDIGSVFEAGARLSYTYLQGLGQPLPSLNRFHRRQLWAIRWNYFKSRFTGREFNAMDIIGKLAMQMGHDLSPDQLMELAWLWYQPLSQRVTIEPGLADLLAGFQMGGLKLGVLSNTFVPSAVLDRHLRELGLIDLLPVRVYSCDVGYRKPEARIFELAMGQIALPPEQILFVGDSPKADIIGASRVGMIAVLKDPNDLHTTGEVVKHAGHRIHQLAELSAIIAGYNGPAAIR